MDGAACAIHLLLNRMSTPDSRPLRQIRSYMRRQGRMTVAQQQALQDFEARYCLDSRQPYDYAQVFGRQAPLILEIGFGNGETLAAMAAAHPERDYIGVDVHRPGIGQLLLRLQQLELDNVRIYCHDAVEILRDRIADHSLSGVQLFFPDPWPKTKHHKRRIVQPDFIALVACKLCAGGYFHAATDWEPYAQVMRTVLAAEPQLQCAHANSAFAARPDDRPLTKFEKRGLGLGHGVWDLIYTKIPR